MAAIAAAGLGTNACSGSIGSELSESGRLLNDALARFRSLPGMPVYVIEVESPKNEQLMRIDHLGDRQLLIGSAFKTFIVTKCLQDIEADRLAYTQAIEINDLVRVNNSPVFINLAGSVQLLSVLDAICAYSDNTATDAAMATVGVERIRAFIAAAGLNATRIPDSIRIFESYAGGAPLNVDIGWEGVKQLMQGILPGTPRPAINNQVSILSTTNELVSYYRHVLRGDYFTQTKTLGEFKRIHAQGNRLFDALPEIFIYAKEGDASWLEFNALCFPGQMVLSNGTKVTFAFAANWNGPETERGGVVTKFFTAITDAFSALKELYAPV